MFFTVQRGKLVSADGLVCLEVFEGSFCKSEFYVSQALRFTIPAEVALSPCRGSDS